jgi:hypothetical protein
MGRSNSGFAQHSQSPSIRREPVQWHAKPHRYGQPWRKLGESKIFPKTERDGKSSAVTEARKLLAMHASEFTEHTTIEAKVLCELEMTNYYDR